jgi:DNA polymerase I-like protein with 3'-5' exonuclease and polymerase domains
LGTKAGWAEIITTRMGSQAALVSAFNLLFRELPSGVLIVGTAHDEVILEADRKDAAEVEAWAKRIMVKEMAALLPGMPVEVESTVCDNWSQKR